MSPNNSYSTPPLPSPTGGPSPLPNGPSNLKKIAEAQRLLLFSILSTLLAFIFPPAYLLAVGFQLYAVWNLGKTLNMPMAWLWMLLTLIPLVGLLVLLMLNGKATTALQSHGVKVGLMGANPNSIQ